MKSYKNTWHNLTTFPTWQLGTLWLVLSEWDPSKVGRSITSESDKLKHPWASPMWPPQVNIDVRPDEKSKRSWSLIKTLDTIFTSLWWEWHPDHSQLFDSVFLTWWILQMIQEGKSTCKEALKTAQKSPYCKCTWKMSVQSEGTTVSEVQMHSCSPVISYRRILPEHNNHVHRNRWGNQRWTVCLLWEDKTDPCCHKKTICRPEELCTSWHIP